MKPIELEGKQKNIASVMEREADSITIEEESIVENYRREGEVGSIPNTSQDDLANNLANKNSSTNTTTMPNPSS